MRTSLRIAVICLVCLHIAATCGQTVNTRRQISKLITLHPIESRAEDVKKLLGEPLSKSPDFYKLEEFNVQATYGSGSPCDLGCIQKGQYCGWNVPRGTLITLAIIVKEPFHQKDLKKLEIDVSKYERDENTDHIPGMTHYSNDEQGIGININGHQVESIDLFPAKKYFHFMCPQTKEEPICHDVRPLRCVKHWEAHPQSSL